jgi:hypothetical protein
MLKPIYQDLQQKLLKTICYYFKINYSITSIYLFKKKLNIMNAYFINVTKEEKENILDKHKSVYDGYVTNYAQPNQQSLYVQDFANDKEGITISNKGNVMNYRHMNINEDTSSGSEVDGTKNAETFGREMGEMHDMIGDGDNDLEHGTFGDSEDTCPHCNGLGYDDYTEEECEWCGGNGYHNELNMSDYDEKDIDFEDLDVTDFDELGEEDIEPLTEQVNKTLDMFRRFKNY